MRCRMACVSQRCCQGRTFMRHNTRSLSGHACSPCDTILLCGQAGLDPATIGRARGCKARHGVASTAKETAATRDDRRTEMSVRAIRSGISLVLSLCTTSAMLSQSSLSVKGSHSDCANQTQPWISWLFTHLESHQVRAESYNILFTSFAAEVVQQHRPEDSAPFALSRQEGHLLQVGSDQVPSYSQRPL